jgi:hypothetical protein
VDSSPPFSDEDSTLDNRQSSASATESDTLHSRDETSRASSSSELSTASSKGKDTAIKQSKKAENDKHSGENLVGKINNLVTTDLANIVEARDFLLAVFFIPLQITLCIVFLYAVLGWR